ncbi:MAG: protein kinase domain-containing protein [Thermoanaerobaculia bacterium]
MNVSAGTRIGNYEILAPLGAGGMGEVYRARDERIGRDVAIKILPPSFAENEDRLTRFESEARAAGALNHPNLVTIHELGRHEGAPFIAMELLDGSSLRGLLDDHGTGAAKDEASRVSPIPQRKAIEYAVQIATGLAAAHDRGVVHRDLKPENIFVTADGRVKILDFGLAKQTGADAGDQQDAATAKRDTAPGTVMGTVGYMSPEQVRGQTVDHRTDIFSFGAVLYEMLTGRRAFRGDSQVETMNAILKEDPPELAQSRGSTVSGVSPALEQIVRHCLEKNRNERFHSIHDVAFALGHLSSMSGQSEAMSLASSPPRFPARMVALVALAALLGGFAIGWVANRPSSGDAATRGQIPPQILRPFSFSGHDNSPAASPDGRTVVFSSSRDGRQRIWLRQVSGGGELALTEGPDGFPSFSPDGTTILFVRAAESGRSDVFRVPALGGQARKILEDCVDAAWSPDGTRIAALRHSQRADGYDTKVLLVNPDGSGLVELATILNVAAQHPRWSPDGKRIAVSDQSPGYRNRRPSIVGLDGKVSEPSLLENAGLHSNVVWLDDERIVMAEVTSTTYAPSGMGSRVFLKNLATGESMVLFYTDSPAFRIDVTPEGRVVTDQMVVRQNLREAPLPGLAGTEHWLTRGSSQDRQPAYARDGKSVVFSTTMSGNLDIWSVSTEDGALRRLTEDPADDFDPALSPDGKHLVWSSRRSGNYEIWIANADGTEARQLTRDGIDAENPTMTPDGEWVVYNSYNPARVGIWKIRPDGKDDTRLVSEGTAQLPEVSPDGKWVAYSTSMVGTRSLSVVGIDGGEVHRVTELRYIPAAGMAGNFSPGRARWSADGNALAYLDCIQSGACGLRMQQFEFGKDTRSTKRDLTPFDLFAPPESFSMSPDGAKMVLSESDQMERLVITDPIALLARRAAK